MSKDLQEAIKTTHEKMINSEFYKSFIKLEREYNTLINRTKEEIVSFENEKLDFATKKITYFLIFLKEQNVCDLLEPNNLEKVTKMYQNILGVNYDMKNMVVGLIYEQLGMLLINDRKVKPIDEQIILELLQNKARGFSMHNHFIQNMNSNTPLMNKIYNLNCNDIEFSGQAEFLKAIHDFHTKNNRYEPYLEKTITPDIQSQYEKIFVTTFMQTLFEKNKEALAKTIKVYDNETFNFYEGSKGLSSEYNQKENITIISFNEYPIVNIIGKIDNINEFFDKRFEVIYDNRNFDTNNNNNVAMKKKISMPKIK